MADEKYALPQDPQYRADNMRKLRDTDPVNASEVVNPTLIEPILESLAYLNEHKSELSPDGKVPASQLPLGAPGGVAALGEDGKVPESQLPEMDYDPAGSADEVGEALNLHIADKNNPHNVTVQQIGASPADHTHSAADVGAVPATQKGAAGGIATLDDSGKVPADQLPSMDYIPTSQKGAAGGVASLGEDGKVPEALLPVQGGLVAQATAPSNTKLGWIDTGHGNILKYFSGSAWTPIGSVWG